jgi:hypothetical protein
MIIEVFKACFTGSIAYRIFSGVLFIAILCWYFWGIKEVQKKDDISPKKMEQSINNSPNATAYQAGRDIKN